ncbi:MFS general substrate transporter [Stereum hirsutum FP-91666 SS1]|uniref:MFS general substrate transporter n=1 Tax=Stereum hirsutum (strain FP-91666) TaxID=721885 RepID=UPI000440B806|nr:MFS general substrate transporter [Stereum hirsutum FP-91666 SS1]EIM89145.1 MFS general substrate transporter [Stereum hirsutum FP-91666 SS1]
MASEKHLSSSPVSGGEYAPPPPQDVSAWKKVLYYLWDSDQYLKSPEERHMLRKLDCGMLLYVSGMKEDLNIQGNEYTYMSTCYIIGFAIMQIPASFIVLKVRPSYFLFVCEIGWTIFTFAQAGAKTSGMMYFFRFMVGLFESAFSPVIIFLMGSWQLAKRLAIWHLTGFVGQAVSGFLQAAIYNTLDGRNGLAGWRWLYIICGLMSTPVALFCLFVLPDYPTNCKIWYITEQERQIALRRSVNAGRTEVTGHVSTALFKKMFGRWKWWLLVIAYLFYGSSCQANSYFAIYLKAMGYSVTERNIIPAGANLVSAATTFIYGFGSDLTRNRFYWILCPLIFVQWTGNGILAVWPDNHQARFAAFFICSAEYMTAVFWTWANEVCNSDAEERAITIASMNGVFYACNAWIPNVIFQQTDGPTFRKGFPATWAFGVMAVIFVVPVELLHRREVLLEAQSKDHGKDEESKSVDGETDSAEKVKAGVMVQTLAK